MVKRKNQIPQKRLNLVVLSKQIEKLQKQNSLNEKMIDTIQESHNAHITLLGNFAQHDIKNHIQNIDSVISTNSADEITDENISSLKASLAMIRVALREFSTLVPHAHSKVFPAHWITQAIGLINREGFKQNSIVFSEESNREDNLELKMSFQTCFQLVNNLIVNAQKSLENVNGEKRIKLEVSVDEDHVFIRVFDNGNVIAENIKDKLFENGFSTTGGSGIGLFHAKYLCDSSKGSIELCMPTKDPDFTKCFVITLPLKKEDI